MLQFVQIGVQMFDTHLMIGTSDRAFKQAPNAFNPGENLKKGSDLHI